MTGTTAGEGTRHCEGGTLSISTAAGQLLSSQSTVGAIEVEMGHSEIGEGTECARREPLEGVSERDSWQARLDGFALCLGVNQRSMYS